MRPLSLAVVGFGRLGRACGEAIAAAEGLRLAGFVRRAEVAEKPLPDEFRGVRSVADVASLGAVDAVLLCLPAELVGAAAHDLLQHRIPVVECAAHSAEEFRGQRERLHHVAQRHRVAAILGAGWDPGAIDLFRSMFAVLIPKGHTESRDRPGVSLHHTLIAAAVKGVRDALCTEVRSVEGRLQRYVYVELAPDADFEEVAALIRSDPPFLNEETLVFPVDSVAALEEEGRGIVLERRGSAGKAGHQMLLLEARYDVAILAAQVMVAAARALRGMPPGAHALAEVPLNLLQPANVRP